MAKPPFVSRFLPTKEPEPPRSPGTTLKSGNPPQSAVEQALALSITGLARIAEEVWRLDRRVKRAVRATGDEQLRGVCDSVVRLTDALDGIGIKAESHDGMRYDAGLKLDIAHVDGATTTDEPLWVIETVRPTIRFDGTVVAPGQVVLSNKAPEVTD